MRGNGVSIYVHRHALENPGRSRAGLGTKLLIQLEHFVVEIGPEGPTMVHALAVRFLNDIGVAPHEGAPSPAHTDTGLSRRQLATRSHHFIKT